MDLGLLHLNNRRYKMMSRKARRKAYVDYQMRGRDLPKARLYYTYVYPLFNWIHGVLYDIQARATTVPSTRFHHFECNYSGLTGEQENALSSMVVGYADGFYSWLGGGIFRGSGLFGLEDFTDEQATVLLKVTQSFVEGFGGTWVDGEVYSIDSEGVRNG